MYDGYSGLAEAPGGRARRLGIVAFGGGTGLPVLLAGLRDRGEVHVTAVVTVADDGGSSGRLREELGVLPPGDIRNCLVALAGRKRWAEVFSHRFAGGSELQDHAVGNLILAALAEMSGDFCSGVQRAARLLRVRGEVYPAADRSLTLVVHHSEGTHRGESAVAYLTRPPIARVEVDPGDAATPPPVLAAIDSADAVVLAPGSLFTSTIPALLGDGTRAALKRFDGPVVYVANLMTQPSETHGFSVSDHVRAIHDHVGPVVTDVVVPDAPAPEQLVARWRARGSDPVPIDDAALLARGVRVHRAPLLGDPALNEIHHHPAQLAGAVLDLVASRRAVLA